MKQIIKYIFKKVKNNSFILFLLIFNSVYSQVNQDTVKGYHKKDLELPNPSSILEAYTYDPDTDRYIYTKTFEGFNIDYPIVLTPEEYQKLIQKEATRKYFQEKLDAIDGKKEASKNKKKDLLPRYYINSKFFETVFGSNTIDVKPTGTVEVDLGLRYSKQDNPAITPQNRSTTTFDFSQRVSLGLQGLVGTRLKVNANYDTQSTFAFQNLIKLEYAPTEDDILQKIEVGNVSMPLNSTLIRGAQSLFGVKAQLKFGRTTFTGVFSEQKSQTKTVTSQGGGTIQDFNLFALDYDSDRHYFLSQYFRNKYDIALKNYPFIDSRVHITRVEVWITNRQNRVNTGNDGNNLRNIVALADIGESRITGLTDPEIISVSPPATFFNVPSDTPPNNENNNFDPTKIGQATSNLNLSIRDVSNVSNGFVGVTAAEGTDYGKLENARKLTPNEFTFHPQLGYISLNQRLANDEVLAVAYQYTIGDVVYQVGEFGTDVSTGVSTNTPTSQALILKMLKGNLTAVNKPTWNLMMKNIYQIPGAYQLDSKDFKFNIVYSDPSPLNYIKPANSTSPLPVGVDQTVLLKVFNLDKLNSTNDPQVGGDGFFDFIPGITVDVQNGRLIFTSVEPFGKHLFEKLRNTAFEDYNNTVTGYNDNQRKYVYRNLYRNTPAAAMQEADKNKFQLKGKYKSSSGAGISLGASNVPRGSVHVTAGGRVLQEGIDYTVNYQSGTVQILDPSIQASGIPIQATVENNSVFGQQTRRFMGLNVEHKFSDKFLIGATYLNLSERPFTQKSNYGQESVNNTMFGFNTIFSTEVPFLTRLANKLPFVDTDVASNLSFRGEVAFLKPGTPSADKFEGQSTVYVDDFEGSQSTIDMKSPLAWSLSSVPVGFEINPAIAPNNTPEDIVRSYGYKRAKLSWYSIDPVFYSDSRPSGLNDNDVSKQDTRRIYSKELFPRTDIAAGESTVLNTLDLTYYPQERGPYNFDPSAVGGTLSNPQTNFGGITRSLTTTNFEQSNVEYIQFWMLDPYYDATNAITNTSNVGKLVFNLGEISEDILKDGKKMYENGLPTPGLTPNITNNAWGKIPNSQSLIYAFDTNESNRSIQDVGLNGLTDAEENAKYTNFAGDDPAQDNYQYFLNAPGNIVDRYRKYNGTEGNSPVNVSDTDRGSTVLPDVEDINRDNTMGTIDAYYKFAVDIKPNMVVGDKYVTNILETTSETLPNGRTIPSRWIQFKIPIKEITPANIEGSISDFRSIRFMRMFMTGFTDKVTLRFGTLELVRGDWRKYLPSLQPVLDNNPDDDPTGFDVVGVNLQENSDKTPIRYVMPPGVQREQLYNNNTVLNQNEQSLSLRVYDKNNPQSGVQGLESGDSRAAFKNVNVDMRQYKRLKMFLHAEALPKPGESNPLQNGQMSAFIRFGNDFTDNFYQVEIPLKVTPEGSNSAEQVWPSENEIDIKTDLLTQMKILNINGGQVVDINGIFFKNATDLDSSAKAGMKVGIKGNPNFGQVRTLMVGLKNNTGGYVRGEVWFNELRLAELENEGGMAAIAALDTNLADLATLSATGRMNTIGFGSIEQKPNERSREDVKQYDIVTNVNVGKLMPKKWGMTIPFNYAVGEQIITPEYDPFNLDIKLKQLIDVTADQSKKDFYRDRAIDFTKRSSYNLIGVRKERGEKQKQHFYDPENLTLSYSFSQVEHHDFQVENLLDQQARTSADYAYTFKPKPVEPFKNTKYFKKSNYWKLLSEFNFNWLPNNINFSSTILRQYNYQQFRQVEVQGIGLDPLYKRNYLFNYNYGFGYNITKALRANYTATSGNLVRNYIDSKGNVDNSYGIWTDYWNIGEPNQHSQQLTVNYELPLNKIPVLSFIKSDYTYTGDYSWQRASLALQTYTDETSGITYNLGNTIQNANTHKLNTTFNMSTLYKYFGLVKSSEKLANKKPTVAPPVKAPKPGEKVVAKPKEKEIKPNPLLDGVIGVLTSVKTLQINYNETNGTMLPGYLPSIGFFGTSKPTLGFVFGLQDDVRFEAAKNGWLTDYPNFNQSFTQLKSKHLAGTASIEPFADFKIDLIADRTESQNFSEQYNVQNGIYTPQSPYNTGNFSITTNLIKTAFAQSDEMGSETFEQFKNNRLTIANRLANERGIDLSNPLNIDANGFPKGFGRNSQQVLLPSFLAAYTGADASGISLGAFRNIPIPNWTIKYTGLMRYKFFKDNFKRFSVQHGYKAAYTINSFRSNLNYDKDPNALDTNGNYISQNIIGNVNLTEQFSPLVRLDFEMKNSIKILAEMKKDRTMSLSFDNGLLTELKGTEYIIGLGYRIKDVTLRSRLAENGGILRSDINFRADLSFRNNMTIVRSLDTNNNQIGGGQNIISAKVTGDYSLSKNLTALFFFDYTFSKSIISTSFPITNIRTGFTVRYNFGN